MLARVVAVAAALALIGAYAAASPTDSSIDECLTIEAVTVEVYMTYPRAGLEAVVLSGTELRHVFRAEGSSSDLVVVYERRGEEWCGISSYEVSPDVIDALNGAGT